MAAAIFKSSVSCRSFSVFLRSPLVCAKRKTEATTKPELEPEEPKKPPSTFIMYIKENFENAKKENPNTVPKDLMKMLTNEWKNLSESEKKQYQLKYDTKLKEYLCNMYKYYQQGKNSEQRSHDYSPARRAVLKALQLKFGKPVPPQNYFLKFAMDYAEKLGKPFSIPEGIDEGKEKWSQLPEAEKEKYILEAKAQREEYQKELRKWEKKMLEDGYDLLVRAKTLKSAKRFTAIDL